MSSCPAIAVRRTASLGSPMCRASTSLGASKKTWMAGSSPAMTRKRVTFLATGLAPYWADGERPETARSRQAFEKRPGQADPRQGVAAGYAGARRFAGGSAQSRHRPGYGRAWRADRAAAAARQFLGPPRRLRQ